MAYFSELPDLQVLNRTKNQVSNDEKLIVKNIFKRAETERRYRFSGFCF
jgi:hypothetical protein